MSANEMAPNSESGEIKDATATKQKWPLWKKFAIVGLILVIVIPLAVGLGVGLSNRGGDDDDNNDNDNGGNNNGGGGGGDNEGDGATPRPSMWLPSVGSSWQIVLLKPIKADSNGDFTPDNVDVYDLDVFDNNVTTFKTLQDAGKKVICYFSAGSYENWRPDKDLWNQDDLGKELDGWPGERWVKLSSPTVRNVMKKRVALAASKGCDAIDPDNVDGYQNDNGLGLTEQDSIDFMRFIAEEAKGYNMSTGLKNAGDIIPKVLDVVHFSVNEQCVEFGECETFADFIDDNKPVFNIEYPSDAPNVASSKSSEICSKKGKAAGTEGFSIVIKNMNLDGWVQYCDGDKATTQIFSR